MHLNTQGFPSSWSHNNRQMCMLEYKHRGQCWRIFTLDWAQDPVKNVYLWNYLCPDSGHATFKSSLPAFTKQLP